MKELQGALAFAQASNLVRKDVGLRVIPRSLSGYLTYGSNPFPEGLTLGMHERAVFGAWAERAEQPTTK